MDDKHDPNGSVPIGTFQATSDDGEIEIPIEIVGDDELEIEEGQLAIQAGPDSRGHRQILQGDEPPRRQRVATLLGVPLPGSAAVFASGVRAASRDASDPTRASKREISAAVDDALDERPTTIYGYKRDSLADLESLVEAEYTEIPTSELTGEIVGVVGRSSDTGTYEIEVHDLPEPRARKSSVPVLAPAQFIEARARDAKSPAEASAPVDVVARDAAGLDRLREEPPTAAIASRSERKEYKDAPRIERKAAESQRERVASEPPPKKPISSLAPVELKRGPAKPREPSSSIGYALVAAMVLLGLGGWFLTAGGYRRASDPASQPSAAANVARPSDALASSKLAAMPAPSTPEPMALADSTAPVEQAAPAPAPAFAPGEAGAPRPRVASKTVRKPRGPAPPAQANGEIETPSRDDVLNGLDRVRSNVRACAEGRQGVAEVDLTIAANGIVTNALVGGDFGGTPQGSCIARAVRRARFPTFKQDRYRVLFPYIL